MTSQARDTDVAGIVAIRSLGKRDYVPLWHEMQRFTEERSATTADEIWFTEHPPVFTLGLNASHEHVLDAGDIPVVQIDRGGQVTYHGPGQLMVYPLIDLRRAALGVRDLVTALEQSIVDLAAAHDIHAASRADAPGVYVDGRKIASVGLRVRRGASFHGMALNIQVGLEPFSRINPCGFEELEVINLQDLGVAESRTAIQRELLPILLRHLRMESREVIARDD